MRSTRTPTIPPARPAPRAASAPASVPCWIWRSLASMSSRVIGRPGSTLGIGGSSGSGAADAARLPGDGAADEEDGEDDPVGGPRPVAAEGAAGLGLEETEDADAEEHDTETEEEGAGEAEEDVPPEALEWRDGLLADVGDDEVAQLDDELWERGGGRVRRFGVV